VLSEDSLWIGSPFVTSLTTHMNNSSWGILLGCLQLVCFVRDTLVCVPERMYCCFGWLLIGSGFMPCFRFLSISHLLTFSLFYIIICLLINTLHNCNKILTSIYLYFGNEKHIT
jgi:hypothetical protein